MLIPVSVWVWVGTYQPVLGAGAAAGVCAGGSSEGLVLHGPGQGSWVQPGPGHGARLGPGAAWLWCRRDWVLGSSGRGLSGTAVWLFVTPGACLFLYIELKM